MNLFEVILWPVNTVIAVLGLALAALELQHSQEVKRRVEGESRRFHLEHFDITDQTGIDQDEFSESISREISTQSDSRIKAPSWLESFRGAYFAPRGSRVFFDENGRATRFNTLPFFIRWLPLIVSLATLIAYNQTGGIPYGIGAAVVFSYVWSRIMRTGIYLSKVGDAAHFVCGFLRLGKAELVAIDIFPEGVGRFGVLTTLSVSGVSNGRIRFLESHCDWHEAIAATVGSASVFWHGDNEGKVPLTVSRKFTDPIEDHLFSYLKYFRFGILAFNYLLAEAVVNTIWKKWVRNERHIKLDTKQELRETSEREGWGENPSSRE